MSVQNATACDTDEQDVSVADIGDEESSVDRFLGSSFSIDRQGTVRPGVMVPKKGCPPNLVELYSKMVSQGKSWKEISASMGSDSNGKAWLTMTNCDYFTLRPQDCSNPAHADLIKKQYAQDGILKKIPMSFPLDDIDRMLSIRLTAYTAGGLAHQGIYRGENLVCQTPVAVQGGKHAFGQPRMTEKPCEPDKCQLYQSKKCKMRGGFIFRIPRVPGIGVWALYTSSFHSMKSIRNKLLAIKQLINGWGSLSHLQGGIFYLAKFKKKVGVDRNVQDLITIDTDFPVDQIVEMLKAEHEKRTGTVARTVVTRKAPADQREILQTGEVVDTATGEVSVPAEKTQDPVGVKKPQESPAVSTIPAEAKKPEPAKTATAPAAVPEKQAAAPAKPATPPAAAKPQTPVRPAPTGGKTGEFADIPDQVLASFLEAISKNPLFEQVNAKRAMFESFCRLKQGLPTKDLNKEAVRKFIAAIQTDLKWGAKELLKQTVGSPEPVQEAASAPEGELAGIAPGVLM